MTGPRLVGTADELQQRDEHREQHEERDRPRNDCRSRTIATPDPDYEGYCHCTLYYKEK